MTPQGCINSSLNVMKEYLPQPGMSSSPYSEGGALYALGLIHAYHGAGIIKYCESPCLFCFITFSRVHDGSRMHMIANSAHGFNFHTGMES